MPSFVIFSMGQSARRAMFKGASVRIGRDASNEIVLQTDTVSREHACFERNAEGRWTIRCVSQKNPIVVDGKIVTEAKVVEGTEVLVGSEHLVIFSENEVQAKLYMGSALL